jgi:catechol 2,3-dioxygenase-like lactoylglutathione lyase family enzyme
MAWRAKMEKLTATTVFFYVQNLDRAIDFYTNTLGMPLKVRHGNHWAEVNAGSISIGLHPLEEGESLSADGGGTVSFSVSDLDALVRELKEKGAAIGEIRTPPRGRFVMGKDSEGNSLHFIEFSEKWKSETGYKAGV